MIIETYGNFYMADPKSIGENEHKSIENLKQRILKNSQYQSNLIINLTWFDCNKAEELLLWINKHKIENSTKIYLTAYVDGGHWFTEMPVYQDLINLGCIIEFDGFSPTSWNTWIPGWMHEYSISDVTLNQNPQYTFLSYNRKPKYHRKELVQKIIDNNLLNFGWVTYQHGEFKEVDNYSGNTDQELHSSDLRFSRPEDLQYLGNMNIWNHSYCVIVSETEPTDPWQISEKTWKPIIGMRPYFINGNSNITKILKELDFYTPGDFFDNKELDEGKIEPLINQLKVLSNKNSSELYSLWIEQQEMLVHNKNKFNELKLNH